MPTRSLHSISQEAESILPWIIERRRHLHKYPELSFQEEKTSEFLRKELIALGYEPSAPVADGKYGFTADLISETNPEEFILLRADFDALPIQEENDIPFQSQVPGVAHLCGHDVHSSMLLGAARLLKHRAQEMPVSVRFAFQHAEEVAPGGAVDFVSAGALDRVKACFGIHVSPRVEKGKIGWRSGRMMAAVGGLTVKIRGVGCHAAMPHEGIDPMPAAANAIMALQTLPSRRVAPAEPLVVSVTFINGGTAYNQIPNEVTFGGTFRTYNEDRIEEIKGWIRDVVESSARAHGCEAEIELYHSYPPLVNSPAAVEAAKFAAEILFGPENVTEVELNMGGEDFAYFARERPSAFVNLGVREEGKPAYSLHHCKFLPQDEILWRGSALLASLPWTALKYVG